MSGNDTKELQAIAHQLFGSVAGIPFVYLREVKRYFYDTATKKIALRLPNGHHVAYWIKGRSLGALICKAETDEALAAQPLVCQIIRLDQLPTINIEIKANKSGEPIRSQGRRLRIGEHVDLNAWPGAGSPPHKCVEIEAFIDTLLSVVAGLPVISR